MSGENHRTSQSHSGEMVHNNCPNCGNHVIVQSFMFSILITEKGVPVQKRGCPLAATSLCGVCGLMQVMAQTGKAFMAPLNRIEG